MSNTYDVLVIGAGSGGMATAKRAAGNGKTVGVIENRTAGGTCVARGCMPKKFLVLASRRMREIQAGGPHGLEAEVTELSWTDIIDHEQSIVDDLIDSNRDGLTDREGIDLIDGKATFLDNNRLEVGGESYEAENIVIATGLRPTKPPIEGVEYGLTSDEFLTERTLPYSMAIVGGGYIGVEFASVLDFFGVDVTIFQRPDFLINGHDRDMAKNLKSRFQDRGIEVMTGSEVQKIEKVDRNYVLEYSRNGNRNRFRTDRVLVSAGRRPNTDQLGLEKTGLDSDGGFISTDSTLETEVDGLYAVGDVNGHKQFTPVAIAEGKVAAENIAGNDDEIDYSAVPAAVFTTPEIGSVGLSENEAENNFDAIQTATKSFRPFSSVVRREPEETTIKIIYEGDDRRVVGLHVIGPHASEMVQGFAPGMRNGLYQDDFKDFPGIHPTIAEEIFSTKP